MISHESIEKNLGLLIVLTILIVSVGGLVQIVPLFFQTSTTQPVAGLKPYTPLQLSGRDVYIREGCVGCHSQMVRPFRAETERYGHYSVAGEYVYDRPFLWGSKRTGPDLAREGGVRPDDWHVRHFANPQSIVPRSNMPAYAFLKEARLDPATVRSHYRALAGLYRPGEFGAQEADFTALSSRTEMDALVAYVQWLGHAVPRECAVGDLSAVNPLAADAGAVNRGMALYGANCAQCHGDHGEGMPGAVPSLIDDEFLGQKGDGPDGAYFGLISCGSDAKKKIGRPGDPGGGMSAFGGQLSDQDIWSLIAWIRSQQKHEREEAHH